MTAVIYIATPIDQANLQTDLPWTRIVRGARRVASMVPGVIAYHPAKAFTVGDECGVNPVIEQINRVALDHSHGLVAVIPKGVPTIGVPRELEKAMNEGLPVAVVTDATGSFALHDVKQFPMTYTGLEDAIKYVRDESRAAAREEARELVWFVGERGKEPSRAHSTDAGFDLYVSEEVTIPPGGFVDIHTDVRVAMSPAMWGRIVGRSSTRRRRGLLVIEGVIDAGYRGLIYTGVQNMTDEPVRVLPGERLAQFIPHYNLAGMTVPSTSYSIDEFSAIPHDGRGEGGFGSSGS